LVLQNVTEICLELYPLHATNAVVVVLNEITLLWYH